ncbi:hypothetical protein C2S51_000362 [Perilla frutescens var. frutescens]|nr:hypothetical protein C2S51_000362 [Perilla frutescens var. frutescens]
MAPVDERVHKAFHAMKSIGISPETTKPILKQLLKLYDKNWQLIEEDNYRTLADSIFQYEEDKEAGKNDEMVNIDMEPPLKKQHRGNGEGKALSFKDKGKGIARSEEGEVPPARTKITELHQSHSGHPTNELHHRVSRPLNGSIYKAPIEDHPDPDSPDHGKKNAIVLWSPQLANSSHVGAGSTNPSLDEAIVAKSGLKKVFHKVRDITKGTEKLKISLVDEIGNEDLPQFVYCSGNIPYESAYVHVSLARIADEDCCSGCKGDCLMSPIPCECARSTGGELAYTKEGLLTQKFIQSLDNKHVTYCQDCPLERAKNPDFPGNCKGHILKMFIKECWIKCGCNMQCGNRLVQRGITRKLEVFLTSKGKGWGLRTLEELPQGAFVCEYVGEILTNIELYKRNTARSCDKHKHVYPVLLDSDWSTEENLKDEEALCLDATNYGNVARFINHRCEDANLMDIPVQVETPDRHYYHVAFFTKRKVDALEELTWDYQIDFEDNDHPIEAFHCCCGNAKVKALAATRREESSLSNVKRPLEEKLLTPPPSKKSKGIASALSVVPQPSAPRYSSSEYRLRFHLSSKRGSKFTFERTPFEVKVKELEASLKAGTMTDEAPDFDAWVNSVEFDSYKEAFYQEGAAVVVEAIKAKMPDLDLSFLEAEEEAGAQEKDRAVGAAIEVGKEAEVRGEGDVAVEDAAKAGDEAST